MAPQDALERDADGRRLAVAGAVAAAALPLIAAVIGNSLLRGRPDASPGAALDSPLFYRDHAVGLAAVSLLLALGYLAAALPLDYLYRAAKGRRPEIPAVARVMTYLGPALLAVGAIVFQVALTVQAHDYLAHHRGDYFAARAVGTSGASLVASGIGQAGALALGFAFVLICLNAMRVGLLTRFMGVLGIIAGALLVIPLGTQTEVVRIFWLGALAYLISGRWPNRVPAAWRTGRAEPWPSSRERREREPTEGSGEPADGGRPAPPHSDSPGEGASRAGASAPRSRKRKRR